MNEAMLTEEQVLFGILFVVIVTATLASTADLLVVAVKARRKRREDA